MARGDCYDCRLYSWQLRETEEGGVFIRYDSNTINSANKGKYNTSPIVGVVEVEDSIRVTTKSGSIYFFNRDKVAYPMHLVSLGMRFGVEF